MINASPPEPPPRPTRAVTTGTASPAPPPSTARHRLPQHRSSLQDASPSSSPRRDPFLRRRSSLLSLSSIGEVTQSFTDDIIDPRTGRRARNGDREEELSHWHSSPLAFAILPAIGGLTFTNGSAFVTDLLLLGLAAIFMNWSIRLPWDWYYTSQAVRQDVEPQNLDDDELDDETAVETASSADGSPKDDSSAQPGSPIETNFSAGNLSRRQEAAADLRRQELLALGATFVFPALAAYLLHVIRAQLSTPSTGLVSDYNLTIFLLAAEIRPVRQVIRLIASRTIYLQRTANGSDDLLSAPSTNKATIDDLTARILEVEGKLLDNTIVPSNMSLAQKGEVRELNNEIQKRYEPRIDSLERAMRRYEKRASSLTNQVDDRLQHLEHRLQEAISLAAVTAQYSQRHGVVQGATNIVYKMVALPLQVAYDICLWPWKALDELYWKVKTILLGPAPPRSTKRKTSRHDASTGTGKEDRPRDKGTVRKSIR